VPSRQQLEWLIFAVLAATAAIFIAPPHTPIDGALPFVIVLLSVCGFVAERWPAAIQTATILLFVPAIFLIDEHTRLFAYGIIAAATFAFAVAIAPRTPSASIALTVAGVLLLRWIPFSQVILWRELVVLLGAMAIVMTGRLRPTAAHIAAALAIALFTPIFPARMLVFPFLVAILLMIPLPRIAIAAPLVAAAFFMRYSIEVLCVVTAFVILSREDGEGSRGQRSFAALRMTIPIALLALWPWSGIVARAFPAVLFAEQESPRSHPVWIAIARAQSVSLDIPPGVRRVVITASGANAARLPGGRAVGWVDGGGTRKMIRIGDIADFGFMRREHFFASRNRPPRTPLDDIHDYGASAWLHTAGRIAITSPRPITALQVTAAPDLPPGAKLQIEAVEFE
jgi:hypothetical protein